MMIVMIRLIVMMMIIHVTDLVAIVPVKTIDNAPANLETQKIKYLFILYKFLIETHTR